MEILKKQWTKREIDKLLKENGYAIKKGRGKGTHRIYINSFGDIISIPKSRNRMIIKRLIKENNLVLGEK